MYLFVDLMLTALYGVCGQLSKITGHKLEHKENGNIQRVFLQVRSKDSHVKKHKQTALYCLHATIHPLTLYK
jgi:hypothetical protein